MSNQAGSWGGALAGLGVGLLAGIVLMGQSGGPPPVNPQERGLDANLWLQTSGEYRACCLQTYRLAGEKLKQQVARAPKGKPLAVVLDLDETVFDNSAFQSYLFRERIPYSQADWDRWEKERPDEVRLVPGALEFIRLAEKLGVVPVYLSNRKKDLQSSTVEALKRLGLNTSDPRHQLLLATTTSDKDPRRREVAKRYAVLMLVGDNLRDFSEEFRAPRDLREDDVEAARKAIAERKGKVDAHTGEWGDRWIVLPNPVYGEWMKLLPRDPVRVLNPSGFERAK